MFLHDIQKAFGRRLVLGTLGTAALITLVFALFAIVKSYISFQTIAETESLRVAQSVLQNADTSITSETLSAEASSILQRRAGERRDRVAALALYENGKRIGASALTQRDRQLLPLLAAPDAAPALGEIQVDLQFALRRITFVAAVSVQSRADNKRRQAVAAFTMSQLTRHDIFGMIRNLIFQVLIGSVLIGLVTAQILHPILADQQRQLVLAALNLLNGNIDSLKLLGNAIAQRDSDTHAHNFRVTNYSIRLAERLGLDDETIRNLIKGAFLHDVGKIGITDNILLKPGRLNEKEFKEMRRHVDYGVEILAPSDWLSGAIDVVQNHHEKYGGGGYPRALSGEDIPINARIFAVADVFDALTSKRPYKEPISFESSISMLEDGRTQHFDPAILDAFLGMAPVLYEETMTKSDAEVEEEMDRHVQRYFFSEQPL